MSSSSSLVIQARKKLYDQSPSLPEPDTKSSMHIQHELRRGKNRITQSFLFSVLFLNINVFITSYYISIFACICKILFHLLTHLQCQFCMKIHKFHIPVEAKMNQLKVDADDSIFQYSTKSYKLFL